jgi:DNA primase
VIPDEVIAEVRERTDIVVVIGEHVQLKKTGVSHKGLCPFHQEKTPSFHVNGARRSFYCFGCQKKGDVFRFLMEVGGKSFVEVVRELAQRAGVTVPERPASPEETAWRSERQRLFEVNGVAARFYEQVLDDERAGATGRAYLASRGIGDEVRARFRLGMALDSWDGLARHLELAHQPLDQALALGLVAERKQGRGHYDKFRNRIMCPVLLPAGEVAGFSGRTLRSSDPETPKYLNSPESSIYKKSQLLFGLHAARPAFARKGRAILVEGNFDVVALHQAGFDETVAPLGTALTGEQVELLRRLAGSVVVCLDGDRAGRAAAKKSFQLLLAANVAVRVVELPDGEDPDSFVRRHGAAALEDRIARAKSVIDYLIDLIWAPTDQSPERQAAALREFAPILESMPERITRDFTVDKLAKAFRVDAGVVRRALKNPQEAPRARERAVVHGAAPPPPSELKVFGLLADHPDLQPLADQLGIRSLLTDARLRDMYSAAQADRTFLDVAPNDIADLVAREVMSGRYAKANFSDARRALVEMVRVLESDRLAAEVHKLAGQRDDAISRGDQTRARELSLLLMQTRRQADELRRRPEEEPR